jgi:thymidylate synthase
MIKHLNAEWIPTFDAEWLSTLNEILHYGEEVSPRGSLTLEIPHHTVVVDMRYPVLICPQRKLNYRFMAAEAFWILSGDDTVAGIEPWNPNVVAFSDDGKTFYGAYGPRIMHQLPYVIDKLISDRDTRQAVITTWIQKPKQSKDIPCTVAFDFKIRDNKLYLHVFMRSSDVWLGLPYDVFNFSMLAVLVCSIVNTLGGDDWKAVEPGLLFLTAASSHLYKQHFEMAKECLKTCDLEIEVPEVPTDLYMRKDQGRSLMEYLQLLRSVKKGDPLRWWEIRK